MLMIGREEFEELVAQALDAIPRQLAGLIDNVAVFVDDEPDPPEPGLLGRYEGVPLTARGQWYAGVLPDRLTISALTIQSCTSSAIDPRGLPVLIRVGLPGRMPSFGVSVHVDNVRAVRRQLLAAKPEGGAWGWTCGRGGSSTWQSRWPA